MDNLKKVKKQPKKDVDLLKNQSTENIKNQILEFNSGESEFDKNSNYTVDMPTFFNVFNTKRYENSLYQVNNMIQKFILKSIKYFNIDLDDNFMETAIPVLKAENLVKYFESKKPDNNLFQSFLKNIFISELLFNDDLMTLLGQGSFNKAYELYKSQNLYIIKEIMEAEEDIIEPYKEYLIGLKLTFEVCDFLPNFTNPICIFNLKESAIKNYKMEPHTYDDTFEYQCEYDNKYNHLYDYKR